MNSRVLETGLGFFGIAWSEAGLTRLVLPEREPALAQRRLAASAGRDTHARSPDFVEAAVAAIKAYAAGTAADLSGLPVDLSGVEAFDATIYAATRRLAFGETATYGELARLAGHPGMARETGAALGRNTVPLVIPCHRVVASGGGIGGFSAPGGAGTKRRLLEHEGVRLGAAPPAQASLPF